jgi:hypothetical protein
MSNSKNKSILEVVANNFAAITILIIVVAEVLEALTVFLKRRARRQIANWSKPKETSGKWAPGESPHNAANNVCRRSGVHDRRSPISANTKLFGRSGKQEQRVACDRRATCWTPYPS